MKTKHEKLNYGNWVSLNMIKMMAGGFLTSTAICITSFFFFTEKWPTPVIWTIRMILFALVAVFLVMTLYFIACRALFSYDGKHKVQNRVLDYVLTHLEFDKGNILDIGCGNGALAIKAAKKFPLGNIIGMDYWGTIWNFGKEICEKNAELEGVADRVRFQKGDAASLDFPNDYFDGAVSNFVFHEVKSQPDKRLVVKEALRVVKKGGVFAFHDLFLEKQFYGDMEEFIRELKMEGIQEITFIPSVDEIPVPKILQVRFMLGRIGIIYGRK